MRCYLSRDGQSPAELLAVGRDEVKRFGEIVVGTATDLVPDRRRGFGVLLADGQLGVLGGSPGAVRYAQIVRQWTHDVVYLSSADSLTTADRSQLIARHRHRRR